MLLLLLTACSPYADLEDRWTATYDICEPPVPFVREIQSAPPIPEACRVRLIEDFGVADTFETPAMREWVIEALYNLLGRDLGRVSELELTEHVRSPFIERTQEQARRLNTDQVGATLYSFAASKIDHMEEADIDFDGFWYDVDSRTVQINLGWFVVQQADWPMSTAWATRTVHEATHALVGAHAKCVGVQGVGCDEDWSGAYGAHLATAELMMERCDFDQDWRHCDDLGDELRLFRARVMAE